GLTFLRLTEVQQPKTATTLSLRRSFRAFSGKTSVNLDCGSSTTHSTCLPSTPPALLISSSAMTSTSMSDFSLIAMVPVRECRMPTLILSPEVPPPEPPLPAQPERTNGERAEPAARSRPVELSCPSIARRVILLVEEVACFFKGELL